MIDINIILTLFAVFIVALMISFPIINYFTRRLEVSDKFSNLPKRYSEAKEREKRAIEELIGSDNKFIRHYYDVSKNKPKDSIEFRLIRAGKFSPTAPQTFQRVRFAVAVASFIASVYLIGRVASEVSSIMAIGIGAMVSAIVFILVNGYLDRLGKLRQVHYRKLFPDFMDLLIVCVDAGASIEAAMDRVMREFLETEKDFGTHVAIISLEVRAGLALRDALFNFAERINVDEARSLAILFKQSEELGSSIVKTLRTYSIEMRERRMIRAEEKANSLPIKMLFPLALCMFPTNLIIVVLPIGIVVVQMFIGLAPG